MITPERREELEAIAYEIFDALSGERYEPSERGAGWAPTDKGYEDVIHILSRANAVLWDRESPAERRKAALAERKRQQKQAKLVAKRLMGKSLKPQMGDLCSSCGVRYGNHLWKNSDTQNPSEGVWCYSNKYEEFQR